MKGYQFSLRLMLAAVAVVGIGAGLWVAEPPWQLGAFETLLLTFVPAATIILVINSAGMAKALWVGIATTSAFIALSVRLQSTLVLLYDSRIIQSPTDDLMRFAQALSFSFRSAILAWAFAPVVGLLCVFTHWLFIRPPEPKA